MNSLNTAPVSQTLDRLFRDAALADADVMPPADGPDAGVDLAEAFAGLLAAEAEDLHGVYRGYAQNFLNVTPEYGRFLYQCARACRARRIVEFGTSMGVSTIHLAAALRDNGGGALIGTELEPGKAVRAQDHLAQAGLDDLVEIRVGDARQTLALIDGPIDLVLLDGAFSLYLPVLQLLEPHLRTGTVILAENAFDHGNAYLDHVRDPANGYLSQQLAINEGRGNEFTVVTR
ncbi:class I SAM-dependent methyltransferase [Stenotrophomonas sp. 24(2023)]|uniref:O-methyltransferase n=1 Tax=Stenotrophomonas sp. 24(2023) TaxID=3068324 RepID=UPI0027E0B8A4|nr:class I SAM-dependent methyltransferase [Stenotrophomonas sp. 24(2023)]WMJ68921.1 class I SAM-dependent methyltransferase [Stenotrophomonas sp. 24(2023)]